MLNIAKIITDKSGQTLIFPRNIKIESDEVFIEKEDSKIIITSKPKTWREFFLNTPPIFDDIMNER